jgi:hypothetical protein
VAFGLIVIIGAAAAHGEGPDMFDPRERHAMGPSLAAGVFPQYGSAF